MLLACVSVLVFVVACLRRVAVFCLIVTDCRCFGVCCVCVLCDSACCSVFAFFCCFVVLLFVAVFLFMSAVCVAVCLLVFGCLRRLLVCCVCVSCVYCACCLRVCVVRLVLCLLAFVV